MTTTLVGYDSTGEVALEQESMKTSKTRNAARLGWMVVVLAILWGGACVPVSPLGTVVVGPGEEIQLRSLEALTSTGKRGIPRQRAAAMAVADYGPIKGHGVTMGAGLDTLCTAEGGAAAADMVVNDRRVVGVIGTSCSVGAVGAAPILSEAGLAVVSASNTAPSLTSDLRGNAGEHNHAGYFRTASNDLHQGQAVAEFVYRELGLRRMATIDDGDPYTTGFTGAFAAAFEALGGAVVAAGEVDRGESDMMPTLSRIAAEGPEGLFFPLFPGEAAAVARQAGAVEGLEGAALIGSDSLLLAAREVAGFYVVAPELRFGGNVNEATGKSGEQVAAEYAARYGEAPTAASFVHAYDATTLLLRAIEAVAVSDGDTLYIDRTRLREALRGTRGFQGLIGEISCDEYGDCGTGRAYIAQHTDPAVTEITELPVVYVYEPEPQ